MFVIQATVQKQTTALYIVVPPSVYKIYLSISIEMSIRIFCRFTLQITSLEKVIICFSNYERVSANRESSKVILKYVINLKNKVLAGNRELLRAEIVEGRQEGIHKIKHVQQFRPRNK
jgi:hypothetical protein